MVRRRKSPAYQRLKHIQFLEEEVKRLTRELRKYETCYQQVVGLNDRMEWHAACEATREELHKRMEQLRAARRK